MVDAKRNSVLLLLSIIFCSHLGADAVDIAIQQLGKPYVLGEESPERGFDCSGLTLYAYQGTFPLDRTSFQQSMQGSPVSEGFERGDLLFFETFEDKPNVVTHVGIYEAKDAQGNDIMINAEYWGKDDPRNRVSRANFSSKYWQDRFLFARRFVPANQLPFGVFDEIRLLDGVIRGWSYDPDHAESPNTIQIFFDGPAGQGGTLVHSGLTNVSRPDVNSTFSITGIHGFEFTIREEDRDGQTHEVFIYGIDLDDSSKSTLLTGSPMSFTLGSVVQPNLTISTATCPMGTSCSGPPGATFTIEGQGFTPGGNVRRFLQEPSGQVSELTPLLPADGGGRIAWSFTTDCDTPVGVFLVSAVDVATGMSSNSVTEIHQAGGCRLSQELFFDGEGLLDVANVNVRFDEPVIDSAGNLLVVSIHTSVSCNPFGLCGIKFHSIAPTGTLNWSVPRLSELGEYIAADNFAPRSLSLGPNDRVYLQGARATLYAYESDGSQAPGWPVTILGGFNWRFGTENAVAIDDRDGAVYARIGETSSFSTFPTAIARIDFVGLGSNDDPTWRTEYNDGGGPGPIIVGPARDIYSTINGRLVALGRGSGTELCESSPEPFFNGFSGGLEGIFSGHNDTITAYDVNCNSSGIFTTDRDTIGVRGFDEGRVFAIDYPTPFNPDLVRLLSVLRDGTGFWRNSRIVVSPSENPIRAIRHGVLYVLGNDSADGNKYKLFLVDAASGAILSSLETSPACGSCGVAIAPDGTIYLNDLNSTHVYQLD